MLSEILKHDKETIRNNVTIRRAKEDDVDGIFQIASTVGKGEKNHRQGFLMNDYTKNAEKHKSEMLENIKKLEHFYVAQYQEVILGFLMAYTKNEWLESNENWIKDIYWHPEFDKSKLDKFLLIDKTAIHFNLTGLGIGSTIYRTLFKDIKQKDIKNIFAETLIAPMPNFASLEFRIKQEYNLCGLRYEDYLGRTLSTLVYNKEI